MKAFTIASIFAIVATQMAFASVTAGSAPVDRSARRDAIKAQYDAGNVTPPSREKRQSRRELRRANRQDSTQTGGMSPQNRFDSANTQAPSDRQQNRQDRRQDRYNSRNGQVAGELRRDVRQDGYISPEQRYDYHHN